ncbi:hypothetical protein PQG22_07205 [Aquirufa beregesia]
MKNTIIKEIIILIIHVICTGLIVSYFQNKLIPLTAAETLKKENFLNSKRDTYFQALEILNRNLSNTNFTINENFIDKTFRLRGGKYPTELEVNNCFSKLCIYSENDSIPMTFARLFNTDDKKLKPILEMSNFVKLIREDLGYGKTTIDSVGDRYKFITIHRPKDSF